jgi:cell division protein FtsB
VMALRRDVARLEQEAVGLRAEVAEAAQSRTALLNEIAELRGEPASVEGDQ